MTFASYCLRAISWYLPASINWICARRRAIATKNRSRRIFNSRSRPGAPWRGFVEVSAAPAVSFLRPSILLGPETFDPVLIDVEQRRLLRRELQSKLLGGVLADPFEGGLPCHLGS